jgi:hypothetical protein
MSNHKKSPISTGVNTCNINVSKNSLEKPFNSMRKRYSNRLIDILKFYLKVLLIKSNSE